MGEDDFWLGVGAGMVGTGLVLYGAWRLHVASYERGWNGEELKAQGFFGIFGRTTSGDLVLISSFNSGKHDREVNLSLAMQADRIDLIDRQTRQVIEQLNMLEQETKKRARTEIPAEERDFLKEIHDIAKTRLAKPKLDIRQGKSYVA